MTHLTAPDDELEVDGVFAKLLQEHARGRIVQDVRIALAGGNQRFAHFVYVAPVGDTHRNAKPHPRIAVGPVRHGRVDEFRVRHDHRDVVVRANDRAARANQFHLARQARDFDAIPDRDRSFRQNDEPADEIARDILQPKSDPDADRAREHRQRAEMNAGVLEHDEDADDQDEVADDLRDRVLQGPVQPAVDEEAVEKKSLRPRREPEDRDEQRDQQEDLNETERGSRHGRGPKKRNARGVDRGDGEESERGNAQDRGDDRDEVRIELEAREETPDRVALQRLCGGEADGEKDREGQQPQKRHVMPRHVKERLLEQGKVHRFRVAQASSLRTGKRKLATGRVRPTGGPEARVTTQKNTAGAVFFRKSSRPRRGRLLFRSFFFDVFHHVADGLKLLGIFIRHFDGKFFLKCHDQLDDIERVRAQILDERRRGRDLFRIDAELLDDDVLHLLFNWFVRHKNFSVSR